MRPAKRINQGTKKIAADKPISVQLKALPSLAFERRDVNHAWNLRPRGRSANGKLRSLPGNSSHKQDEELRRVARGPRSTSHRVPGICPPSPASRRRWFLQRSGLWARHSSQELAPASDEPSR